MKAIKLLLLFLILISIQLSAQDETIKTAESADGSAIEYLITGEGSPTLVFVHCWNCDKDFWTDQINFFKNNYKIVAVDLAGYGNSTSERENYTIESFGDDVKAVVEKEGLEKIILVGHSMGSSVVLDAASKLGNKVIAIIGVDSYQNFDMEYSQEQKDEFFKQMEKNYEEYCPQFVKMMFPPNADSLVVSRVVSDMCSQDQAIAYSAIVNNLNFDAKPLLEKITIPVRAINSTYFPTNVEGNNQYVNFDAKLMEGVGHFLHMEKPNEFNKLLSETIGELL